MRLAAIALIVAGLAVLLIGGYFWSADAVVCENNPDCVPGWWVPAVLSISAVLIGCGVALAWSRRRR